MIVSVRRARSWLTIRRRYFTLIFCYPFNKSYRVLLASLTCNSNNLLGCNPSRGGAIYLQHVPEKCFAFVLFAKYFFIFLFRPKIKLFFSHIFCPSLSEKLIERRINLLRQWVSSPETKV